MAESRFYFADGAAQGYLINLLGKKNYDEFLKESAEIFAQLNRSLMAIVERFIQKRSAYRRVDEPQVIQSIRVADEHVSIK